MEGRIVFRVLHAVCIDTDRAETNSRYRNPIWMGFRLDWMSMGRGWSYHVCYGSELEDLSNRRNVLYCPPVDYQRAVAAWERSLKPREVQSVELPVRSP